MDRTPQLQVYRFSVSWPRVLPDGQASRPNAKGVDFYHNLIDALLEADIQPMVGPRRCSESALAVTSSDGMFEAP